MKVKLHRKILFKKIKRLKVEKFNLKFYKLNSLNNHKLFYI